MREFLPPLPSVPLLAHFSPSLENKLTGPDYSYRKSGKTLPLDFFLEIRLESCMESFWYE